MHALLKRYPGSTVAMGTFSTVDCDLPDARGRVKAVKAAVKQLFQYKPGDKAAPMLHSRTLGAHCALEVTPTLDDTGQIRWQIHCHALILFKRNYFAHKGKAYIHKDGRLWKGLWGDAIGEDLYLSAEVTPSDVPLRTLRYSLKASHNMLWKQYRDPRYRDRSLPAALIIQRADALKGLTLNIDFGLFKRLEELAEIIGITDAD